MTAFSPLQEWIVTSRVLPFVMLSFVLTAAVSAQTVPDGVPETARVHFGRIRLNPTVALTNAGVDNNVFNASDIDHPRSDFTMTLTPKTDLWFPIGRSWVTASLKEDFVYYREFASERSINSGYRGEIMVPLNRITVKTGGEYLNSRDRPGFEIDARSRHTGTGYHGSAELRAFGKTFVSVGGARSHVAFEPDAVFLGQSLRTELTRTATISDVALRHQLTPVTSVTASVAREADRFEYSPIRDSDSTRAEMGVHFNARIGGSAVVGFRNFQPLDAEVPAYRGATARVDMSIAPFGATRIGVQAGRDVQYSLEKTQPYYVESGGGLSIMQGISGPFDFVGRFGAQRLSYRGRMGTPGLVDRTDSILSFGGGLGYRVGRDMRIGFNVDKQQRNSDLARRSYGGVRYGTSVTYGY
jgi:Putative beta-barrel porin 2